jgi:hypothetical protein
MDSSVTEDAEKGRSPRASTLSAPMSRRELLQATGAATLGALFASTGCEVLTGDDDTPEPLLRRLSKRFYAHGERHQTECYGTVLDPASDAAAYLRVRGARERLVYRPRREAAEAVLTTDTYVLSPCFAGPYLFWSERRGHGPAAPWTLRAVRTGGGPPRQQDVFEPFETAGRPMSLSAWTADDGRAWLVWEERQGRAVQVRMAPIDPSGQVGSPRPVAAGAFNAYDPVCALAPDDTLYVVYTAFWEGSYRIVVQRMRPDGERLGAPERISDVTEPCCYPSVWPAQRGGVWFSFTAWSGYDANHGSDFPWVRHLRYQRQRSAFRRRGIAYVGHLGEDGLRAVAAPRKERPQGFVAAMTVTGSEGAMHTHVFEDAAGRVRLLLRQHATPLEMVDPDADEEDEYEIVFDDEPNPLRVNVEEGLVDMPHHVHPTLGVMTLKDDAWSRPEPLVPRAHLEGPVSFAVEGNRLRVAFTQDGRKTHWRNGEYYDNKGHLGVGTAEVELLSPPEEEAENGGPQDSAERSPSAASEPDYAWYPFRLSPLRGTSLRSPQPPEQAAFGHEGARPAGADYRPVWGQTHCHTDISVCRREFDRDPHFNYRFMQDVQGSCFGALTDHSYNMWHTEMLVMRKLAEYYYFPGAFVAVPAYEWTGSHPDACNHHGGPWGHVVVLYMEEEGDLAIFDPNHPILEAEAADEDASSDEETVDPDDYSFIDFEDPGRHLSGLWDAYDGQRIMTLPHHVADAAHFYNWDFFNDQYTGVIEVFQDYRGSGEAPFAPGVTNRLHKEDGHWIRPQLQNGRRFGLIASGDHMGIALAGLLVTELTREGLYDALQARRTYGSTGQPVRLALTCNGRPMGESVPTERARFQLTAEAAEPIDEVQILRNGEVVDTVAASGREIRHRWQAERQAPGECWYGRLLFENGEIAWTSPIWLDARSEAGRSAS